MAQIAETVSEAIAGPLREAGYDLVDVEYKKEGGAWFLRLTIDKEGGVVIDDCVAASRLVEPLLEERDPIPQEYTLEVSSPGIFRPLTRPEHFKRHLGSTVKVSLFEPLNGQRRWQGALVAADDESVGLEVEGPVTLTLDYKKIAKANLEPELKF